MNAIMTTGNNALTPTSMESAIQLAEMMARGKLVPSHLHNSPGDCLMVIEASMRWQMSPFAVAQCTSVIQGKLMFEGKLVAAALNASGLLSSRLDYEFSGAGQQRAVIVRATVKGEAKPREVTVFLADAKTSNSLWTKQPDQQLVYAGTRVWARRHAPEVMLGVYAPEEFDRAEPFAGPTIEAEAPQPPLDPRLSQMALAEVDAARRKAINDSIPLKAAAAATPRAPRKADPVVYEDAPDPLDETDGRQWLLNLDVALANAQSQDEVVAIGGHASVGHATASAPEHVKRRVSELLAQAFARFAPDGDADLDEVVIKGEAQPGGRLMPDNPTPEAAAALCLMFAALWDAFQEGIGIEACDLEVMVQNTGLAVWLPATEEDVRANEGLELEVGDTLLKLTEEGRAVVKAGRR